MVIYGVYIVSKSGGLIFNLDHNVPKVENELSFNYPLDLKLVLENKKIVVSFGQRDRIMGMLNFSKLKSHNSLSTILTIPWFCSRACSYSHQWDPCYWEPNGRRQGCHGGVGQSGKLPSQVEIQSAESDHK